jgi:hypothetical protein
MTGAVIKYSGFLLQNFPLSTALFFDWTSRYGQGSQDFLPFFFGYERIYIFRGVRELVGILLGYERILIFRFRFLIRFLDMALLHKISCLSFLLDQKRNKKIKAHKKIKSVFL